MALVHCLQNLAPIRSSARVYWGQTVAQHPPAMCKGHEIWVCGKLWDGTQQLIHCHVPNRQNVIMHSYWYLSEDKVRYCIGKISTERPSVDK